ncbi:unnamed protein product [Paramecium sonneborni]|uniref:Uncharacterized protein n=1 Tax=Paramecium sonneborni TaxID=65129 RepID=A0A8S1MMS1_9CILI|nr:unnamed protein product [Paramecium sonneborni]
MDFNYISYYLIIMIVYQCQKGTYEMKWVSCFESKLKQVIDLGRD